MASKDKNGKGSSKGKKKIMPSIQLFERDTFLNNIRMLLNSNKPFDPQELTINMMCHMAEHGIPPETYERVFHLHNTFKENIENMDPDNLEKIQDLLGPEADDDEIDYSGDDDYTADSGKKFETGLTVDFHSRKESTPVVVQSKAKFEPARQELILKVQLDDVSRPPMWRSVAIPSNFTFRQLHLAIQALFGLENKHLWTFTPSMTNQEVIIGPSFEASLGAEMIEHSHNAANTLVTEFLGRKDATFKYTYDFRVDWIFTIKVLDIIDADDPMPHIVEWKSELQLVDDIEGLEDYLDLRDYYTDNHSFSEKKRIDFAKSFDFDDVDSFTLCYINPIDPEAVNDDLEQIVKK
jgi:hypothetical protein